MDITLDIPFERIACPECGAPPREKCRNLAEGRHDDRIRTYFTQMFTESPRQLPLVQFTFSDSPEE